MQRFNIPYYKRFVKIANRINNISLKNQELITHRLKIIEFFDEYGAIATKKVFSVSRSSVFNWKRALKLNNGNLKSLIAKSKAPIHKRTSKINPLIKNFIRNYREKYYCVGQVAIKPALDKYCIENNLQTISQATIARIIKKLKESGKIGGYKCSYNARTGKIRYIIKKSIKKEKKKRLYAESSRSFNSSG